jgi:hypothetical protein
MLVLPRDLAAAPGAEPRQGGSDRLRPAPGGHRVAWNPDGTITPLAAIRVRVRVRALTRDVAWFRARSSGTSLRCGAVLDRFVTQRRLPRRDEPQGHLLVLIFADQPGKPVLTYSVDSSFCTLWRWYPVKR